MILKTSKTEIYQFIVTKIIFGYKCAELLNKAQIELDKVRPSFYQILAAVKAIDKYDLG